MSKLTRKIANMLVYDISYGSPTDNDVFTVHVHIINCNQWDRTCFSSVIIKSNYILTYVEASISLL